MDKKAKAIELAGLGFSTRKIAQILKVSHSTVARWLSNKLGRKRNVTLTEELEEKLKALLMHTTTEKGRSRTLSLRQIYRLLEIDLRMAGINSLSSFYRALQEFVKKEWGGWSELEKKRRPKKEHSKYHTPKGKIRRERAIWEVDATGYSAPDGKTYFLLLAREVWSGYFLGGLIAEVKEGTGATHYNKSFTSLDVARLFVKLFSDYGLPSEIISDNEKILKAEIVERGLRSLNIQVKRTKPYQPHQKLIERSFRDLKDLLRYYTSTHRNFHEALDAAIEVYNTQEHRFSHFSEPVVPAILHQQVEYRKVPEDEIRRAFRERFVRVLRNNTIRIENLTYEFVHPIEERYGEIGRKRKAPTVVCYRDIENASILEVWDEKETRCLGTAKLISQPSPTLDATELREQKNKERRIERRRRKLQEELSKIQLQQERNEGAETIDPLDIFLSQQQEEQKEEEKEELLDIFDLFLGGEA